MAKKSKARNSTSAGTTPRQPSEVPSEGLPSEASESNGEAAAPGQPAAGDEQQLRAELAAAQAEIQALRLQLAEKEQIIADLERERQVSAALQQPQAADAGSAEIEQLQDRLKQLRKEQLDADAAKDAAWRQLKAVIGEISKLSSSSATVVQAGGSTGSTAAPIAAPA